MSCTPSRAADVLAGTARWACEAADCVAWLGALPPASLDLVFGSPPYCGKGRRYSGLSDPLPAPDWVRFMLAATRAAVAACRGDVFWVVNNPVEGGAYVPAVEGLVWGWYSQGGRLDRPVVWHKNAPPSRKDYFGNDWEFVLCFPAPGGRRVWNWEAIGTPPKYKSGGHFRQRGADGTRRRGGDYPKNPVTRPRDVLRAPVGGGLMGHDLAAENEAPFPAALPDVFVRAFTDEGGVVCDPFCGSGSTAQAALAVGRRFLGCDLRESQVDLTARRLSSLGF